MLLKQPLKCWLFLRCFSGAFRGASGLLFLRLRDNVTFQKPQNYPFCSALESLPIHLIGQGCFWSAIYSTPNTPQRYCLHEFSTVPQAHCLSVKANIQMNERQFSGAIFSTRTHENCLSMKGASDIGIRW